MESCIHVIHDWLMHNGLSLNPAKSEVIQFSTRRSRVNKLQSLSVSGNPVQLASSVKSLGVTLDQHVSLDQHINNVCKACYYHIRSLHHVRQSLPHDVARTVAYSIVTSWIDYCNSLYAGISAANFNKLQLVLNTLAHVVHQLSRRDHITVALVQLHWLPVHHRVTVSLSI